MRYEWRGDIEGACVLRSAVAIFRFTRFEEAIYLYSSFLMCVCGARPNL